MVSELCNVPEVYAVPVIALLTGECLDSPTCGLAFWPKFSEPIHYNSGFSTNRFLYSTCWNTQPSCSHDCVKEQISGVAGSGGC